MMFPAPTRTRPLLGVLSATALAAACLTLGTATAAADDDPQPPPLHNVKYTIWAERPFSNLEIYYRDVDPPNWAD